MSKKSKSRNESSHPPVAKGVESNSDAQQASNSTQNDTSSKRKK